MIHWRKSHNNPRLLTAWRLLHQELHDIIRPSIFTIKFFSLDELLPVKMCRLKHFVGEECQHRWMAISAPCAPGKNFFTCPKMSSEQVFLVDRNYMKREAAKVPSGTCPICFPDIVSQPYKDEYLRYITWSRNGVRLGRGPGRRSPGIECYCIVM